MTRTSTLKGIAWMALTGLLFVAVTGIVRHLGTDMSPVQAAFIRYAMGVVIMIPLVLRIKWSRLARGRFGLYLARGLVHGVGVMLWFYAMKKPVFQGFDTPTFFLRNGHETQIHCGLEPCAPVCNCSLVFA